MKQNFIQKQIISWYNSNKRDLPWRGITDPYKIWLSEIILQQTKVNQGISYYLEFINAFPNVKLLALASENTVLKLWQGLGYYSRARNLHAAAKQIHEKGKFPNNYKDLIQLKGVGEYTAAAIASFAFNKAHAVVDGNVFRVISRIYGISTAIDSGAGKREFTDVANKIMLQSNPALWNQAIMEFGALQCIPKAPNCETCPVSNSCVANTEKRIKDFPFKKGKIKQQTRFIYYLYLKWKGNTILIKRPKKGIWGGLYEFPNIELEKKTTIEYALLLLKEKMVIADNELRIISVKESIKHVLSHRILYCSFIEVELESFKNPPKSEIISINELENYPVSRLIEKYLDQS